MNEKLEAMLKGLTAEELSELAHYFEARFERNREPNQLDRIESKLDELLLFMRVELEGSLDDEDEDEDPDGPFPYPTFTTERG